MDAMPSRDATVNTPIWRLS